MFEYWYIERALLPESNYKSCNWIPVIGHPRDRTPITWKVGAQTTNHRQEFYYRYENRNKCFPGAYTDVLWFVQFHFPYRSDMRTIQSRSVNPYKCCHLWVDLWVRSSLSFFPFSFVPTVLSCFPVSASIFFCGKDVRGNGNHVQFISKLVISQT